MAGFMKSALNLFGIGKEGSPAHSAVADYQNISLEQFLEELVNLMGYSVTFSSKGTDDSGIPIYEIQGEDAENLLGDSSEMLEALSHLSMRYQRKKAGLANEAGAENVGDFRVLFDSGDFRQRKINELKELATQKRQKVLDAAGKPTYINALGPAERKVIHTTLTELGDVVSESIGNGYFKRIRVRMINDTRPARSDAGGGGQGRQGAGGRNGGGNRGGGRGPRHNSQQAQGRGRNSQGGGRNRRPQEGAAAEPNGNVIPRENFKDVDDNIGNRLKPGEEPIFGFGDKDSADDRN